MAWVSRQLNLDPSTVRYRAKQLRKDGVDLPELRKYRESNPNSLSQLLKRELES